MITITPASIRDVQLLSKLAYSIWPVAYKNILAKDQMQYMLKLIYSRSSLKKQIKDLNHKFIIVYNDTLPVGFASYSLKLNSTTIYKLHKLYIHQSQQGKGIGKLLIREIINEIKPMGAKYLHLNVNRNNTAIQFYKKNGFKIIAEEDIDIDNGYFMNDYVMEKKVR